MENSCLPISDFIQYLEIMKPLILSATNVGDYIEIRFPLNTHMYEEAYGQVCHIMGIDHSTSEIIRTKRGAET